MKSVVQKSVFMQMHDGERTGEGSFYEGLQGLFYLASTANRYKLVKAFPDFFGDEVPEFGIVKKTIVDKTFKFKGWLCLWDDVQQMYILYTPDELEQPRDFRTEETECETKEMCKQFINSY